jgi:hypothetical protein
MGKGRGFQQYFVHNRKDRRVRADAECDTDYDGDGKSGILKHCPQCHADFVH